MATTTRLPSSGTLSRQGITQHCGNQLNESKPVLIHGQNKFDKTTARWPWIDSLNQKEELR